MRRTDAEETMAGSMQAIRRRTAAEHVYEELHRAIITRSYGPGTELNEVEVARRLGTSVTPVREAFHKLRGDGLMEYVAWKGSRVVDLQPTDVVALFEVRMTLERLALEESVPHLTDAEHDQLRVLTAAYPAPGSDGDVPEAQLSYDRAFHSFFLRRAGGTWASLMLGNIRSLLDLLRYPSSGSPSSNAATVVEHGEIVAAVVARDAGRATAAMNRHLERVEAEVLAEVAERARESKRIAPGTGR